MKTGILIFWRDGDMFVGRLRGRAPIPRRMEVADTLARLICKQLGGRPVP